MFVNEQKPEAVVRKNDHELDVINVWPTIQSEGPFMGTPAVFVRLAGCNIQCKHCDTDYTTNRVQRNTDELISDIMKASGDTIMLVVITGGEPFRQPIRYLVQRLLDLYFTVQIETNGITHNPLLMDMANDTVHPKDPIRRIEHLHVVVSPKGPNVDTTYFRIQRNVYYKYIMEYMGASKDGLPHSVLGRSCQIARPPYFETACKDKIYLQPFDSGNISCNGPDKATVRYTADICMKFGYRLSLQMHKGIGLQ